MNKQEQWERYIIFGGEMPTISDAAQVRMPDRPRQDSVLVISSSGCYMVGDSTIHTTDCACDDDYMQEREA